jgi:hypothetical protein
VTAAYAASVALKLNLPKTLTDSYASFLPPGMDVLLTKMLTRSHENTLASVMSLVGVARAAEGTAQALQLPSAIFSDIGHLFDKAVAKGLSNQDGSSLVEVLLTPRPRHPRRPRSLLVQRAPIGVLDGAATVGRACVPLDEVLHTRRCA